MKEEGHMVNPIFSSVYYVTGSSEEGSLRQVRTWSPVLCGRPCPPCHWPGRVCEELTHMLPADGPPLRGPQAPTVLCDQWFNHEEQCSEPENSAWSSFVFPVRRSLRSLGHAALAAA